jgi:hypothetical protein
MTTTLVLSCAARFADVARAMESRGYVQDAPAAIDGPADDPRTRRWTHAASSAVFARDFASDLCTVVLGGAPPPGLVEGLAVMTATEAEQLVRSAEPRRALAGLKAAAIGRWPELAAAVAERVLDPEPAIAAHAGAALVALEPRLPDARDIDVGAALFAVPGWRREKLQVLRWLALDARNVGERLAALLARALADGDWEIRATAMLAAARLDTKSAAGAIARIVLPESADDGVTPQEHRVLLALRDAALELLGSGRGRVLPPALLAAARERDYAKLPAGVAAFVHALGEPLPAEYPEPPAAAAVDPSDGLVLADGALLVWVPPVPHWIGDDELRRDAQPNAARRVAPGAGFFIDAEPRAHGSLADARAAAAELGARLSRAVALPTADQWEMAARGPDGRRFPWGMNAAAAVRVDLSPWGMAGIVSGAGEWLESGASGAPAVVAGGRRSLVPARRTIARSSENHGFRFVYQNAAQM